MHPPIFLHDQVKLTAAEGMSPAAAMTAVGQNRKSSMGYGMSGVGGKSAVIRSNSDIGIGMSGVGGNPDVAPTWPARPEIAKTGHSMSRPFLAFSAGGSHLAAPQQQP